MIICLILGIITIIDTVLYSKFCDCKFPWFDILPGSGFYYLIKYFIK
jgi:hypothetical protein